MTDVDPREAFESEIIHRLIKDRNYFGTSVPYMKPKFFSDVGNSILFDKMQKYYVENGEAPNHKELVILIKDEPQAKLLVALKSLKEARNTEIEHINEALLIEKTEDFIKKAIHTESLILGAEAMGANDTSMLDKSFSIAEEAQKVSLDSDFGTSVFDVATCMDYYQDETQGLVPPLPSFINAMGRGYLPKTLHTVLAPPGIGKSATLSAFAVDFLKMGQDVVIFSLEMAEAEWMKRILCNVLNVEIATLDHISKEEMVTRINELKGSIGSLIVKEFPSYAVTALQIQNFLEKYKQKHDIKNLVTFVDYLGLMSSGRLSSDNSSYEYIKSITAELRGVAQKLEIPIITAHQLNRGAVNNLDAGQETVSDSAGISMFSDSMMFLLQNKEMKKNGMIRVNFEKNRMTGWTGWFDIGFDYKHMRFIDKYNKDATVDMNLLGAEVKAKNKTQPHNQKLPTEKVHKIADGTGISFTKKKDPSEPEVEVEIDTSVDESELSESRTQVAIR